MPGLRRYIKKVIRDEQEKKVYDRINARQATNDPTTYPFEMRNIIVGDTMTTRSGDSIDIVKFLYDFNVFIPFNTSETLPTAPNYNIRLIIFQWFASPFHENPLGTDILQSYYDATPTTVSNYQSFYNKTNAGKYSILYDKTFLLSEFGPSIKRDHGVLYPPMKTISYSLTDGGSPNFYPTTGEIYLLVVSDTDETAYLPADVDVSFRLVYTDS